MIKVKVNNLNKMKLIYVLKEQQWLMVTVYQFQKSNKILNLNSHKLHKNNVLKIMNW